MTAAAPDQVVEDRPAARPPPRLPGQPGNDPGRQRFVPLDGNHPYAALPGQDAVVSRLPGDGAIHTDPAERLCIAVHQAQAAARTVHCRHLEQLRISRDRPYAAPETSRGEQNDPAGGRSVGGKQDAVIPPPLLPREAMAIRRHLPFEQDAPPSQDAVVPVQEFAAHPPGRLRPQRREPGKTRGNALCVRVCGGQQLHLRGQSRRLECQPKHLKRRVQ